MEQKGERNRVFVLWFLLVKKKPKKKRKKEIKEKKENLKWGGIEGERKWR
jgi:hypothetical protein